jgi:uracil-DNA glycosylase
MDDITWVELYNNNKQTFTFDFLDLDIYQSWIDQGYFELDTKNIKKLEKLLTQCIRNKKNIYPPPNLIFNAFRLTPINNIRFVILGQDPYHQINQAMGLSFSVPDDTAIPSSLNNIYKNLLKYKHIKKMPKSGNLTKWTKLGALMFNTSLTVQESNPNSHTKYWTDFTDNIIEKLSDNHDKLVFVLWGSPALSKLSLINQDKHKVIISSHPSGLSCNKKLNIYPAFMDLDHFGLINSYLEEDLDWSI